MNKNDQSTKKVEAKTTAVEIIPPEVFTSLEQKYRLVKYVLPRVLVFDKSDGKWARMHHEIKENLDVPYRVFTKDSVQGYNRWSLYALFPPKGKNSDVPKDEASTVDSVDIDQLPVVNYAGEQLIATEIPFSQPPLHVLIKLLQVAYGYYKEPGQNTNRFVGQHTCYLYATRSGDSGIFHKCLEMDIRGDIQNENIFYIDGHARTFALDTKMNPDYIHLNTYYTITPIKDNLAIFNQVKRSVVQKSINSPKTLNLYKQITISGKRTTLDYHSIQSMEDTEQTRGYLVDTFIRGFSGFLSSFGFQVNNVSREFHLFDGSNVEDFVLPLDNFDKILFYDARFSKSHALEKYVHLIREVADGLSHDVEFEIVTDLSKCETNPVIIIQDCEAKAFKEGMPLFDETDPHEQIYQEYPNVPKQFLNINSNDPIKTEEGEEETASTLREAYLSYDFEKLSSEQVAMLLNQLFLKDLILNKRSTTSRLPFVSSFMYVHREHQIIKGAKRRFEVAMYFEDDKVHFLDLINSDEQKDEFYRRIDEWNVSWEKCYDEMVARRRGDKDGKDLPDFDVIVGRELFVEITGANEAILYDYDEIMRRHEDFTNQFELDDLKLADRYDEIIDDENLTEEMLELWGYLQHQMRGGRRLKTPKNQAHRDAVNLYESLQQYDQLLDELKGRYPSISFNELTEDENIVPDIVRLFGSPLKLQNQYKKLGMFLGLREAKVVSVYSGIWHTHDFRYVVGDTNSMNIKPQARAHRVRQFIVYQGKDNFDILQQLRAMAVQFVRLNQYTVYPYYFHLIDIYIDSILKHLYKVIDLPSLGDNNDIIDEDYID